MNDIFVQALVWKDIVEKTAQKPSHHHKQCFFSQERGLISNRKKKIPAHTNFLLPCSSEYNPIETSGVLNAEYYRSNPSLQPCRSGIRYHFTRQVAVVFCKQLCFGQRQHEDACKAGWKVQKQYFRSGRNRESLCTVASIKTAYTGSRHLLLRQIGYADFDESNSDSYLP